MATTQPLQGGELVSPISDQPSDGSSAPMLYLMDDIKLQMDLDFGRRGGPVQGVPAMHRLYDDDHPDLPSDGTGTTVGSLPAMIPGTDQCPSIVGEGTFHLITNRVPNDGSAGDSDLMALRTAKAFNGGSEALSLRNSLLMSQTFAATGISTPVGLDQTTLQDKSGLPRSRSITPFSVRDIVVGDQIITPPPLGSCETPPSAGSRHSNTSANSSGTGGDWMHRIDVSSFKQLTDSPMFGGRGYDNGGRRGIRANGTQSMGLLGPPGNPSLDSRDTGSGVQTSNAPPVYTELLPPEHAMKQEQQQAAGCVLRLQPPGNDTNSDITKPETDNNNNTTPVKLRPSGQTVLTDLDDCSDAPPSKRARPDHRPAEITTLSLNDSTLGSAIPPCEPANSPYSPCPPYGYPRQYMPMANAAELRAPFLTASGDVLAPHFATENQHGAGGPSLMRRYPKPTYSYSCLIALALKNSRVGRLQVSEIYNFMCENFPYFRTAPAGWKNSVRHNLSLNKCFEKIEIESPAGHGRKACLWRMNPVKVAKMEQEVIKWRQKDPDGVKDALIRPEDLPLIEKGLKGLPGDNATFMFQPQAALPDLVQHTTSLQAKERFMKPFYHTSANQPSFPLGAFHAPMGYFGPEGPAQLHIAQYTHSAEMLALQQHHRQQQQQEQQLQLQQQQQQQDQKPKERSEPRKQQSPRKEHRTSALFPDTAPSENTYSRSDSANPMHHEQQQQQQEQFQQQQQQQHHHQHEQQQPLYPPIVLSAHHMTPPKLTRAPSYAMMQNHTGTGSPQNGYGRQWGGPQIRHPDPTQSASYHVGDPSTPGAPSPYHHPTPTSGGLLAVSSPAQQQSPYVPQGLGGSYVTPSRGGPPQYATPPSGSYNPQGFAPGCSPAMYRPGGHTAYRGALFGGPGPENSGYPIETTNTENSPCRSYHVL